MVGNFAIGFDDEESYSDTQNELWNIYGRN